MTTNNASLLALVALSTVLAGCVSQAPSAQEPAEPLTHALTGDSRALGGDSDTPTFTAFASNEFGIGLTPNETEVRIDAFEISPRTGVIYKWDATAQTSYEVIAVCSRHANEHYVYGKHSDGSPVLEQWVLVPWTDGAYYTERKPSSTPIGTPVTPSVTNLRYKGPFIDPGQRTTPVLTRTALTAPTGIGKVAEVEVDPEGRYLVFRTVDGAGASTLEQLELSTGSIVTIASPTTHSKLSVAEEFCFIDSTELGRVLVVFTDNLERFFLEDKDNDGVFESSFSVQLGEELYNALPPFTLTWYP